MFAAPLSLIIPSYILIFAKIARESNMSGVSSTITEKCRPGLTATSYKRTSSQRLNSGSFSVGQLRRDLLMKKAKMKALFISILVIVTFIVCWAPYYVCMIYYVIVSKDRSGDPSAQYMFQVIFFFGMSNSVLNPLLYGAFHMVNKSQTCWRKCFKRHRRHSATESAAGSFYRRESTMGPHYSHHTPLETKFSRMSNLSTQRIASFDAAYHPPLGSQGFSSVRRSSYHPGLRVAL
ncbi:hypothetical protein RvY_05709 [Ramazzottius varieornatus]|uniref:G-protein coupled receptors family 1 profile domain-containing protein n=1 Tax=Ramazzottius varieornatus TaxID=947166 RepID=A0A1D1UZL3_RAMVA|nr:hypothetical protein RvY_05709 [Ramazzottius varieornatus]